jgi:hypothetical protein
VVRVSAHDAKESDMNATSLAVSVQSNDGLIVGVDLAKNVFQFCVADARWRPVEAQDLTRAQFERWFANRAVHRILWAVMTRGEAFDANHLSVKPMSA